MKRFAVAVALLASARIAAADPHNVLVLKADGTADAATRARVETAVLKLAKNLDGNVVLGEITFADAAAATGCKPEAPTCRDEVMTTLAVDEIVIPTASVSGGEIHVDVKRAAKGQPVKDATATVATADASDAAFESSLGAMFGVKPATATQPAQPAHAGSGDAIAAQNPSTATDQPLTAPPPAQTEPAPPDQPAQPQPQAAQPQQADQPEQGHRLVWAGIIGGGVLVALGVTLWGAAGQTESQIQAAPTATQSDLQHLRDLESQGDSQAGAGNLLFVTGLVVGGVAGYYLWKDHRHPSTAQARIAPMVGAHTAGLTLTIGGSP